jgi:beta-lactamase class A
VTFLSRRHMLVTTAGLFMPRVLARAQTGGASSTLATLDARAGGRLGVCVLATQTGSKRIRAGLPKDWRAGDKTGTATADSMTDKCNDVAVAWPPGKAPMIVAAYFDSAVKSAETRDEDQAVLAEVGRIAAAWAGGPPGRAGHSEI